jgi:hypothetical protein
MLGFRERKVPVIQPGNLLNLFVIYPARMMITKKYHPNRV